MRFDGDVSVSKLPIVLAQRVTDYLQAVERPQSLRILRLKMNRKAYNKLVRDRIPEIIIASDRRCEVVVMTKDEFGVALREKLVEEAIEAREADAEHLLPSLPISKR